MALGRLAFTAFAGRGPYPIHGLDYLSTAHLSVTVNGTPASATFDDATKTMTLAAAPAAGAAIVVQRATPRREEQRLTQFLNLPTGQGGLTAALLDQDFRQGMLLMGEGRDLADDLEDNVTGMALNVGAQWAGQAKRIETLSPGALPGDVVRKSQIDAAAAAARPLPTVVVGDNDDGLFVNAGEFDDRLPAECRTHLQLGVVATLTAGVAANNVTKLDSSALYPTANGSLIDLTSHPLQAEIGLRSLATVVRFGAQSLASPGVDPSMAGWSQNSATRVNLSGGWGTRVELNNAGDVDGSTISPYRIRLTAGTWRIRWLFKVTMPLAGSATNLTSLRVTNNDDTSAQIVYYDLGSHRPSVDFVNTDWSMFPDSLLLTLAAPDGIVFRYSNKASGGNNFCNLNVLFQRIKA